MLQRTAIFALSDTTHIIPTTQTVMTSSMDMLVDDILIQILQTLSVHTLLSLRKTARRYYLLSKLRCIWYARFCAEVLARNLPPPGPHLPLSMLSAAELERRTLRALHLEQAWSRLSATVLVSTDHHGSDSRVDQVVFIPGGTELLTVQGDKVVHWLIVSWPGIGQGLKRVGEWTPFEGISCRIVKDGEAPGVFAVGPREPLGSHRFAKVLSTSLNAPFVVLCDYTRVPGVVVGVWGQLLLLDTTRELGGGLELLDWHARTTGTALLPRLPDLFGDFLDFVVFSGHLLVVWECGVSVFLIPHVPADGQVVVEHKRVFMFQEAITRPVGFTTCIARRVVPPCLDPSVDPHQDSDWDVALDGECSSFAMGMSPTLTIAGRSRMRPESVSMAMLVPLVDAENCEEAATTCATAFSYRLACLQPHSPVPSWQYPNQEGEDGEEGIGSVGHYTPSGCKALCLGSSGRGIFVVGQQLRLVSPGLHILPPYEMQFGPVFEMGNPLYCMDRHRQRDLNWLDLDGAANVQGGVDEAYWCGDKVDFDEGMGRFIVAKKRGGFEVVQLD